MYKSEYEYKYKSICSWLLAPFLHWLPSLWKAQTMSYKHSIGYASTEGILYVFKRHRLYHLAVRPSPISYLLSHISYLLSLVSCPMSHVSCSISYDIFLIPFEADAFNLQIPSYFKVYTYLKHIDMPSSISIPFRRYLLTRRSLWYELGYARRWIHYCCLPLSVKNLAKNSQLIIWYILDKISVFVLLRE